MKHVMEYVKQTNETKTTAGREGARKLLQTPEKEEKSMS